MDPIVQGALLSTGFSAILKLGDGPFKTVSDYWYMTFGHNIAMKRAKYEAEVKAFEKECIQELEAIPKENRQEPRMCVIGPAIAQAQYFVEEESLRKMFAKLIASASDSRRFTVAHPAFVDIISQLSPFEAKILQDTNILQATIACCKIRFQQSTGDKPLTFTSMNQGHTIIEHFVTFDNPPVDHDEMQLYSSLLDNLTRLKLCEIPPNYTLTDDTLYNKYLSMPILQQHIANYINSFSWPKEYDNYNAFFLKETVTPTAFGEQFYAACIQST